MLNKAIIKLGYSCNNNCIFCHARSKKKYADLNYLAVKKKINLLNKKDIKCILFSGGEATIRKDLFNILDYAKKKGFLTGLITNGRMFSMDSYIKRLLNHNLILCYTTLHSSNEFLHNKISHSYSFKQTIKGIKNMVENKINVLVNIVIIKDNLDTLDKTVALLKKLKVNKIKLSFVEPLTKKDMSFTPDIKSAAEKVKKILGKNNKKPIVGWDGFPLCLMEGYEKRQINLRTEKIFYMSEVWESSFFPTDEGNKIKIDCCVNCKKESECEGIYAFYNRTIDWIRPISVSLIKKKYKQQNIGYYTKIIKKYFPHMKINNLKHYYNCKDNFVIGVNNKLIFKFPKSTDLEHSLKPNVLLLSELHKDITTQIPKPELMWFGNKKYSRPFVGYKKIKGTPLKLYSLNPLESKQVSQQISTFLSELHNFSVKKAASLGIIECKPPIWKEHIEERYKKVQKLVFPFLDKKIKTKIIKEFKSFFGNEKNFKFKPSLIHRDLNPNNLLYLNEEKLISGVIDWDLVIIGDPAFDFGKILHSFDSIFTKQTLKKYKGKNDKSFWDRTIFYSKLITLNDCINTLNTNETDQFRENLKKLNSVFAD